MALEEIWQRIKEGSQAQPNETLLLKELKKSKNPLQELRKSLVWNVAFGMVGVMAGIFLIFYFPALSIRISVGILVLQTLYYNWKMYQRTQALDQVLKNSDLPLLQALQCQLTLTRRTIRMMEIRTMVFLPFAYLAGLLIGGSSDTVNADELIFDYRFLIKGMGISLLTMPALYFGLRWMHQKSFGDFIDQVEAMLSAWDPENGGKK
jgi:hypothetical protein